jgi:hypothetical protein
MAMPMSACLQRRGVVDAVAGHGHHLAIGLQGLHEAQLLLRLDAGKDIDLARRAAQLVRVQHGQFAAGQHRARLRRCRAAGDGAVPCRHGRR